MKKAASLILVLSIFLSVLPVAAANDYDIIIQGEEFSGYTVDGTQKSIIELASAGNTSAEGGGEGVDVGEDIAKSVFLDASENGYFEKQPTYSYVGF